jgi:hypothetical protein
MTTSAGWIRANLVYDTLKDPPSPGSPIEAVCAFVFLSRQRADFIKHKAVVQASIREETKEAAQTLIEELHENMFPDKKRDKEWQKEQAMHIMEKHSAPIKVSKM